jgi:signal transducing adaptor molecule
VRSGEIPGKEAIRQVKKRMFNRNANVVLYTLTLLEALVKNCGGPVQVRLVLAALEIELVAHVGFSMFTH